VHSVIVTNDESLIFSIQEEEQQQLIAKNRFDRYYSDHIHQQPEDDGPKKARLAFSIEEILKPSDRNSDRPAPCAFDRTKKCSFLLQPLCGLLTDRPCTCSFYLPYPAGCFSGPDGSEDSDR